MPILTALITVVHVLVSLLLVVLILLHSGKGGGLSDMFGGGIGASAAGSTVMEKNLDRMTVFAAIIFGMSTFGLALVIN
ncbi:MAG: preprotein translocase subunit SecG [Acidimicrobiia bacterium]